MPTVIRRSDTLTITGKRREVRGALGWQVTSGVWSPPTDLFETPAGFVVSVEIAGMRESDFEVLYDNGVLLISGERPDQPERRAYHQMEIHFGKFSTAVALPGPVDLDNALAEYKNGFLVVRLPRARHTDVKIGE